MTRWQEGQVLEGMPLIDAHVHVARLSGLKPSLSDWVGNSQARGLLEDLYDQNGDPIPDRIDAHFAEERVDTVLLMSEYSPRVTGVQSVEDAIPLLRHNPTRFRLIASVNPNVHYPAVAELLRQLDLGAVALKIHPVHGGFPPNARELYRVYEVCEGRGVPVIFHTGTSMFPGSVNRYGDPALIDDVLGGFPGLTVVLAHGGRGWWYETAAFLAVMRPNVWIDIAGLPPRKLPAYYGELDLARVAKRFIFGSDWPAVPGIRANALGLFELGLDRETLEGILHGNAARVFRLHDR